LQITQSLKKKKNKRSPHDKDYFFIALYGLLPRISYSQKIEWKDLVGVWRAHWELKDSTQDLPRDYLEIIDSSHATWGLWNNELSKFTYRLIYSHGAITSSEITYFSMSGFNKQNQNLNTSAILTRYGNDALKLNG
jgi:hypothetical protein